jgi:maltose O-acetyltransferase
MLSGQEYRFADDPELAAAHARGQELVERLNATPHGQAEERRRLLGSLMAHLGEEAVVQSPFSCDYGDNISIGAGTYVNYGCAFLDPAPIAVGERCQIASGVQLVTATHPLDAARRRDGWELAHPIVLGDNVWLGAGVIVNPGVTIGDDTVVGSGAVVTHDLPAGVVAHGVPARVRPG